MKLWHYSLKPLTKAYSCQQDKTSMKPSGLWVSVGASWKQWCQDESFGLNSLKCKAEIKLDTTKILILSSAAEIDTFTKKYNNDPSSFYIDWQAVADKYSGIIIAPYIYSRRLASHTSWYYPWDCASGCIWDATSIKSIKQILPKQKQFENTLVV